MKALKYILSTFIVLALVFVACDDEQFNDLDFVGTATAPTNISALFKVTQDNTGLVSIAPTADGAAVFEVFYGDDTTEPAKINAGGTTSHTYLEGSYSVKVVAIGITGLKAEATQDLVVSFQAPQFGTEPIIKPDAFKSKQVNVTVPDDALFAINFEAYFVEDGIETILTANVGETVSYTYANPGLVEIKVVLKGAAIATTEFIVTDFEVTEILAPALSAPTPQGKAEVDYISLYSSVYNDIQGTDFNPDWGQAGQGSGFAEFDLNGDKMLQYTNLSYQGVVMANPLNLTTMEFMRFDVWTAKVTKIETSLISQSNGEKPVWRDLVANEWTTIEIPISEFTDQGLTVADIYQLKFVGEPWAGGDVFIDNLYFYKEPTPSSKLTGTWKLASEPGALKVGPAPFNGDWWSNDAQAVIDRACFFDDEYEFGGDGTFSNVLGSETWLEPWQGVGSEQCGTPVAPHDGSAAATYVYDEGAGTLTVNGTGAYIGLPKANNAGELPNTPVPSSITYNVTLSDNDNTMTAVVDWGAGVFWSFKLVRDVSPIVGVWKLAAEPGALKVGPSAGNGDWWSSDAQAVIDRACFFDDEYVFSGNGSFSNVLGNETWIEPWQGVASEQCGAPVAPHDGSAVATFSYDENAGTVTLNGSGSYLGLPKANNQGELPNVPVPFSTTYTVEMSENNTVMTVGVDWGEGVYWTYKFVKN